MLNLIDVYKKLTNAILKSRSPKIHTSKFVLFLKFTNLTCLNAKMKNISQSLIIKNEKENYYHKLI